MNFTEDMAQAWIAATFNDVHGDWQSRFSAENMEAAFAAGFKAGGIAAQPASAIQWEFQSKDGSWKSCRNANDAATWAADGFKIRESA